MTRWLEVAHHLNRNIFFLYAAVGGGFLLSKTSSSSLPLHHVKQSPTSPNTPSYSPDAMLKLWCTSHLLSILIVIINSAIAAEVVAHAPSPTSSSSSDMAVAQALMTIKAYNRKCRVLTMYDSKKQIVPKDAYGGIAAKHYGREMTLHNAR